MPENFLLKLEKEKPNLLKVKVLDIKNNKIN